MQCLNSCVANLHYSCSETRAFLKFLKDIEYDHRRRPDAESKNPTFVEVSILIGSIRKVSEVSMVR